MTFIIVALGFFAFSYTHAQSLPNGCATSSGYSSTSGQSCNDMSTSTMAGCSSTAGFSTTTGLLCNGSGTVNGTFGPYGSNGYFVGCNSASGYSTATGMPCSASSRPSQSITLLGGVYYPVGCTSSIGYSSVIGVKCVGYSTFGAASSALSGSSTTPGLPRTGDGTKAPLNFALMLGAGLVAAGALRYGMRLQ